MYNNYGMGGAGSYNYGMPMGGAMGMMPPMGGAPMGLYNNFGSGGAGSHNFGRKKREAQFNDFGARLGNYVGNIVTDGINLFGRKKRSPQTYQNFGSGGAGSTNFNYGHSYNNWGSGGAGSRNFWG